MRQVFIIMLFFSYTAIANDIRMPIPPPDRDAARPITGYQPVEKPQTLDTPPQQPDELTPDTPDMDNIQEKEPSSYMEEFAPKVDEPLVNEPLPNEERLVPEPLIMEPNIIEPTSTEPVIQAPNVPNDLPVPAMGEPFIPEPREPKM